MCACAHLDVHLQRGQDRHRSKRRRNSVVGGLNLELAGSPVPSQIYEIAWACTAAPVLNLVLLLNLACSCTTSTAVLYLSTYLQLGTSLLVPEDYPVAI